MPDLDLDEIPGYETSSEEDLGDQDASRTQSSVPYKEDEDTNQPEHYKESMQYIQDFYSRQKPDSSSEDISRGQPKEDSIVEEIA